MSFPLCERFGFDEANIKQRLAVLGLRDADRSLAGRLQQSVITPHFTAIIKEFFTTMASWPEAQKVLKDKETTGRVKRTITTFLLSLGSGFNSASYFEHRLHVGLAHEAVGLSLSLYLCAYRTLTQAIINNFPDTIRADAALQLQLVEFLNKISTLDMSLAIDTYHKSLVQNLEQSIDGMQAREAQLLHKAITDSLTGMINREHIFSELDLVLKRSKQHNTPVCVIMADIDHFKRVNDTYGHQAGDIVLKDVAQRIKKSLRDFDRVGRYGGEEFMLILQNTTLDVATRVAERIRLRIADHPIILPNSILEATISMGVAEARSEDEVASLLERADQALYQSKHNGRNRVTLAAA